MSATTLESCLTRKRVSLTVQMIRYVLSAWELGYPTDLSGRRSLYEGSDGRLFRSHRRVVLEADLSNGAVAGIEVG